MGTEAATGGLSLAWALPFAGLLLSIALFPLLARHWWERHFGAVTTGWALLFALPYGAIFGADVATRAVLASAAHQYFPFIILLLALFVVAGGIRVVGNLVGTPVTNTAILALGTAAASLLGTTGASMLLIRPLIRANSDRRHTEHVFVFFIFLVGNIGGGLTPLGDPPLFLGFLHGVSFGWTLVAMAAPTALASGLLLSLFFAIDRMAWKKDAPDWPESRVPRRVRVEGWHNLFFLAAIVAIVPASGVWASHRGLRLGIALSLDDALRDLALLAVALASYLTTRASIRIENAFTWVPIREVAVLFAGIFITIIPVLGILREGSRGPLGFLLDAVTRPDGRPVEAAYFWLAGALSSVLDNAPTYLVFFDLAGGDPHRLMGALSRTLLAISMGAVFMGANTYIGNAPNFMVKAICEEQGIRMPSFFGYLLWSGAILLPLFVVLTVLFFR